MKISKCHKKNAFRTRVIQRIEEITREEWDSVFPDVLESYNFFKTLDESNLSQFKLFYILVYNGKRLVGATHCFLVNYSLDTSISGPLRRISNAIKKAAPNLFSLKAFVCGMPMGQGRIGVTPDSSGALEAILRRMERIARKERAPIIAFKDFDHSYAGILDPLQRDGFVKMESLPTTQINVWFSDFEEYLKTLSAASRYDLRRKFKKADKLAGIKMEIVSSLDEAALTDVYRMYLDIVEKHDMGFELLPKEFFRLLSKNMPKETKYFLWRIDGKLAAFLLCLVSDEMLIDYYVGLDYKIALEYHLYFLKFRDVMNWCIKNKIKCYEMGITGYEPKRRLGFDFIPLYLYAKIRNKALRPIFKILCGILRFENFDPALKKGKTARRKKAATLQNI